MTPRVPSDFKITRRTHPLTPYGLREAEGT